MFSMQSDNCIPFVHIYDIIPLFAAEFEEPKIGISGKGLFRVKCIDLSVAKIFTLIDAKYMYITCRYLLQKVEESGSSSDSQRQKEESDGRTGDESCCPGKGEPEAGSREQLFKSRVWVIATRERGSEGKVEQHWVFAGQDRGGARISSIH